MLETAHQGYIYQDILGAYFVAKEIAYGNNTTKFLFDQKKTPDGIQDKFDDLAIFHETSTFYIQVKYSNNEHQHRLTKDDFASTSTYDLALFDLYETWKALNNSNTKWRILLAWNIPLHDDPIQSILIELSDATNLLPGTSCYKFDCDSLWPEHSGVQRSWRALRAKSQTINRSSFKSFLDSLVLEVNCPKSTLLQDYTHGLEKQLAYMIEKIGVGVYPNDHLSLRQVAESLTTIVKWQRASNIAKAISCDEIAQKINIILSHGGIEQKFPIDKKMLIETPDRVYQVVSALQCYHSIVLTAEPGAGKSWFIENLQKYYQKTTQIVRHYCYIALDDPLVLKRITVNALYGSLITQILQTDKTIGQHLTQRYASNLQQLNILLSKIQKKTLLIIDGIDHIWRIYQKNRGGLTENETVILNALNQLDYSNPNISLLIISQPIHELSKLSRFHHCTLAQLQESYIQELLIKHSVKNLNIEGIFLSHAIHEKSNGNALYGKYLVEHAEHNTTAASFSWINSLPHYDFNLTSYYQYLYEQLQGDSRVPYALCGADFSISEKELQEITHLGSMVTNQLTHLKPVLKYVPALGYSIYHESFKRFIINTITSLGGSIPHLIYNPLIKWLETHSFFESTKAYGHLLQLYYEVDDLDKIEKSITIDFLDKSLFYAQPLYRIRQNHNLQIASLQQSTSLKNIVTISEQTKVVYELEYSISDQVLIKYLMAIKMIHGDDMMYRVLCDGENLIVDRYDAFHFLVNQARHGNTTVHWSIIPINKKSIPYNELGFIAIKLLHTEQYDKFDTFVKSFKKNITALQYINDEVEEWCIFRGKAWLKNTPQYREIIKVLSHSKTSLTQAIESIITDEGFHFDDNWNKKITEVVALSKTATPKEINEVIGMLSNYNWFRNWLIYLIRITELSQKKHANIDILDTFSYLVRDLEPFKGTPRTCDLYKQLPLIKRSFYQGLLLCKDNVELRYKCILFLEKLTALTTSLQHSFSGPLTDEDFLELISYNLPGKFVIEKFKEYYNPCDNTRIYSDIAKVAFNYAYNLSNYQMHDDAIIKYTEGIQSLTAYGMRKDRTLSEVLYCSVPYQKNYRSLNSNWFYELYHMSMAVVAHTDGKSTKQYPIEWFSEFIKVFPNDALKFLICKTLDNGEVYWHQETEFYHLLKNNAALFTPIQWFLLCRSIPLLSSNEILEYGINTRNQIPTELSETYHGWIRSRPFINHRKSEHESYSKEVLDKYNTLFHESLEIQKKQISDNSMAEDNSPLVPFPTESAEDALAFLETNKVNSQHAPQILKLVLSLEEWDIKKNKLFFNWQSVSKT